MKSRKLSLIAVIALVMSLFPLGVSLAAGGGDSRTEMKGIIESMPARGVVGHWIVAGRTVHVTYSTRIVQDVGPVEVGASVEVRGTERTDGSIDASKIIVNDEVKPASGGGSEAEVKGAIESLPATPNLVGDWRIAGRIVHVGASTRIDQEHGRVALGALVEAKGAFRGDGSLDATRIEVQGSGQDGEDQNEVTGTIESLPGTSGFVGDWRIAGRTVHVSSSTRIDQEHGSVAVGVLVEAKGTLRSDGSLDATEIEVKSGSSSGEGEMTFKGTIESLPGTADFTGDWRVGGRVVHVTSSTRIEQEDGPVAVGAFAEIEGSTRSDGSLAATKIEIKSNVSGGDGRDELKGRIDSLPGGADLVGDWVVAGRTVHVTSSAQIDQEHGRAAVGAQVEVKGTARTDGSIDASRIEVKASADDSSGSGSGSAINLKGSIESMPSSGVVGDWMISGRLVHVISSTRIKQEHGPVGVGVRVKVKGLQMSDGSVVASRIQVRD